jgi:hypothetical protein
MPADRFGPMTVAVEGVLERAAQLTEAEADVMWKVHLQQREHEWQFHAALEAVVHAAVRSNRMRSLERAERAGREAVTVYGTRKLGDAISGYVGRLAEAMAVSDRVDAVSLEPLTRPWVAAIGPLDLG